MHLYELIRASVFAPLLLYFKASTHHAVRILGGYWCLLRACCGASMTGVRRVCSAWVIWTAGYAMLWQDKWHVPTILPSDTDQPTARCQMSGRYHGSRPKSAMIALIGISWRHAGLPRNTMSFQKQQSLVVLSCLVRLLLISLSVKFFIDIYNDFVLTFHRHPSPLSFSTSYHH